MTEADCDFLVYCLFLLIVLTVCAEIGVCALTQQLHSVAGSRGKGEIKASIFVFHFCLIPLISEGISGPIMIERPLARLTLPGAGAV